MTVKVKLINYSIKKKEGPVFVYTNRIENGAEILGAALEANGMENFFKGLSKKGKVITRSDKPKYAIWTGGTTPDDRRIINDSYNLPKNKDGSVLKVIIGTNAMSEGVTLKKTSQLHILDPKWNQSGMEQVIGRAIRHKSHGEEGNWLVRVPKGYDRPIV